MLTKTEHPLMSKTRKSTKAKITMSETHHILTEKQPSSTLGQTQFNVAMHYWDKRNIAQTERWLRYATQEGHELARDFLTLGIKMGFFFNASNHLSAFSNEILEHLITPLPEERHIKAVETILLNHLKDEFGLQAIN